MWIVDVPSGGEPDVLCAVCSVTGRILFVSRGVKNTPVFGLRLLQPYEPLRVFRAGASPGTNSILPVTLQTAHKTSGSPPEGPFGGQKMIYGLDLQQLPVYRSSAHKVFRTGEKHVRRVSGEDVLILMLDGTLHFLEDGVEVDLEKGEYYIQRRGLLQEGRLPSDDAKYYYIHFLGEYREGEQALPLRGVGDFSALLPVFGTLDFLQLSGGSEVEKAALFYRILSGILKKERQTQHRQVVTQVMMMIQEDIRHPFTLQELANRCGYSPNSIITFFKEETGQTPFEFIQNARIDAAKRQLANSDLPAGIIAEECGFSGYVNFYKSFVKQEGIAPLVWRKKQRTEGKGRS